MAPGSFASLNINHLKILNVKYLLNNHIIFTQKRLELMIEKGSPEKIKDEKDLGEDIPCTL